MTRRALALGALLLVAPAAESPAEEIGRRVGRVTFRVDTSRPSRAVSSWSGSRRGPASGEPGRSSTGGGRRSTRTAGSSGLSCRWRPPPSRARHPRRRDRRPGGRAAHRHPDHPRPPHLPPRYVFLDSRLRALVAHPDAARDGRRLLAVLRTASKTPSPGLLLPPVGTAGGGFGEPRTHTGSAEVEGRIDGLQGERHRGVDYALPPGTPARAPAAGTVLLAGPLLLSGQTVVIDHGQGVLSVLQHLSRVDVRVGEAVSAAAVVGLSGTRASPRLPCCSGASTSTGWPWTRR